MGVQPLTPFFVYRDFNYLNRKVIENVDDFYCYYYQNETRVKYLLGNGIATYKTFPSVTWFGEKEFPTDIARYENDKEKKIEMQKIILYACAALMTEQDFLLVTGKAFLSDDGGKVKNESIGSYSYSAGNDLQESVATKSAKSLQEIKLEIVKTFFDIQVQVA